MAQVEARAAALAALYEAEALDLDAVLADDLSAKATRIAEGVWAHRSALDTEIDDASTGWRVERMPSVDRNVLRMAVWEMRNTHTPVAVIVSEAVGLAKEFSTERSGAFVNGVLGKLARQIDGD